MEIDEAIALTTVATHIPQVLLVVLQIICTLHKWCSSLIQITSNGVVQMYYSICKVNLRNVGRKTYRFFYLSINHEKQDIQIPLWVFATLLHR